jgi:hypothetical protein
MKWVKKIKEIQMANKKVLLGMLGIVLALGLLVSSCATASSIGGTADAHGLISKAKVVTEDAQPIASYSVILGLVDSGYPDYAAAVKAAEDQGKKITTVTTFYFVLNKVTAYAR